MGNTSQTCVRAISRRSSGCTCTVSSISRKLYLCLQAREATCIKMKVVAVFPKGGDASKNDKYVNCEENALGLRSWAEKNKAELIVTSSKDGSDSGLTRSHLTILAAAFATLGQHCSWDLTHVHMHCHVMLTCQHAYAWYLLMRTGCNLGAAPPSSGHDTVKGCNACVTVS